MSEQTIYSGIGGREIVNTTFTERQLIEPSRSFKKWLM